MATLLLAAVGPMQSWGTRSKFDDRDTEREPSKSGILGLVCAALGRDRNEPIDDLRRLKMGVRCDREGELRKDFQTAQDVATAGGGKKSIISNRWYLADAAFLVGLEGDEKLLAQIYVALKSPCWPLALGRKSYVPSKGPWLPDALYYKELLKALIDYPALDDNAKDQKSKVRFVLESSEKTPNIRMDDPVSFALHKRKFERRYVDFVYMERRDVFQ